MTDHSSTLQREYHFTDRDFGRVQKLIYDIAGIALSANKKEMVYSRVIRRVRATNAASFSSYLDALERDVHSKEWVAFTNALTTNKTSFFREEHHFPVLADYAASLDSPISIWCAASSTGEEPYSIAMTLCDAFENMCPPVNIIASDIDTNVLEIADKGVYAIDRLGGVSNERIKKYFLKGRGAQEGFAIVRPELRRLIQFKQINLLANDWPVVRQVDVIFCRNVMIYFDKPTQRKVLSRFATLLKPNGLLFAGHSENFAELTGEFKLRGKTVYERLN